ncbi:MAG TPA: hypothetical protein VKV25_01970, partial [Acidimicrobiales bacterium]|nr:hypothetical protein [Acidimicrobiales bacterium]
PSRRFVRAGGVTLTHEGLCEYEVVDGGWALALTLVRATGTISRPAPALRPNAAGPATPVPGAQLPGSLRLRYAVAVGDVDPWRCSDLAWNPLEVLHAAGGGSLGPAGSHLEVRGGEVSALRRVADQLELRVFNPGEEATVVSVPGRSGWLVDLAGRPMDRWDGSFVLPARGVATARIAP